MKKRIIHILIMTVAFLNIEIVNALDFPATINVSYGSLMQKDGWKIYQKSYSGGGASGKAFCSTFWLDAPSGVCRQTNWANGIDKNVKASAAVGYIIDKARSNNSGSMSWDNYYYAEMAINKFLYDERFKYGDGDIIATGNNNVNGNQSIVNKISTVVANAHSIYKTYYNNDTIEITEFTLNGKKLNGNTFKTNEGMKEYLLKVVMKCYDKNKNQDGNQIKCDLPKSDGSYSLKNGQIKSLPSPKVSYAGKNVIFTYTIPTEAIIGLTEGQTDNSNPNIIVNFSNRKAYKYAQRYGCDGNVQTMVPNYILSSYSNLKYTTRNFKIITTSTPSSPPPDDSCIVDSNPEKNASTYQKFADKNEKYAVDYAKLLDVNSPECGELKPVEDLTCEKTNIENEWVEQIKFDDLAKTASRTTEKTGNFSALCKAKFSFDNYVSENKTSQKKSLIFSPSNKEDDVFGRATISIDCNVPYFYNSNKGEYNLDFDLSELIPDISFEVPLGGNTSKAELYKIIDSDDCDIDNESKTISCLNYYSTEDGYGWRFDVDVDYVYGDENRYMISPESGDIVPWEKDNFSFGYGIKVSDSVDKIDNGEATLKFTNNKLFGSKSKDTNCSFKIVPQKAELKNSVKYRTINSNKPFTRIDGNARNTGSNWCGGNVEENDVQDITNENACDSESVEINGICYHLGDVNQNGVLDYNDAAMITKYAARKIKFSKVQEKLAKVNDDDVINVLDALVIQKKIKANVGNDDQGIIDENACNPITNCYQLGDVNQNGVLDYNDAIMIEKYTTGNIDLTSDQKILAEFNRDGRIDVLDASAIKEIVNSNLENKDNPGLEEYKIITDGATISIDDSSGEGVYTKDHASLAGLCKSDNAIVKKYITDRPNSNGRKPIYSFTLDAKTIKYIRENKDVDILQNIYSSASGLCIGQTTGYCDVEDVLRKNGVIK